MGLAGLVNYNSTVIASQDDELNLEKCMQATITHTMVAAVKSTSVTIDLTIGWPIVLHKPVAIRENRAPLAD